MHQLNFFGGVAQQENRTKAFRPRSGHFNRYSLLSSQLLLCVPFFRWIRHCAVSVSLFMVFHLI